MSQGSSAPFVGGSRLSDAIRVPVDRPRAMVDDLQSRFVIVDGDVKVYQPVLRMYFFEPGRGRRRPLHFLQAPWLIDNPYVSELRQSQAVRVWIMWERPHWPDSNPDDVALLWQDPNEHDREHWYIGEVPKDTPVARSQDALLRIHDTVADMRFTCNDDPLKVGFHYWMPQNGLNWNPAGIVAAWSDWTTASDASITSRP